MLARVPKPIRIFFCRHCRDVTPVATDRHRDYCEDCQYPTDWPRHGKTTERKIEPYENPGRIHDLPISRQQEYQLRHPERQAQRYRAWKKTNKGKAANTCYYETKKTAGLSTVKAIDNSKA
jgi:hypothetical protein